MEDSNSENNKESIANDVVASFANPAIDDYIRREVMVKMRDGVEIFVMLLIPNNTKEAPIILENSPYGAQKLTNLNKAIPTYKAQVYSFHAELLEAGYILAVSDVRGKYKSGGRYELNLPLSGDFNENECDYSTDIYDTIDWLINNVEECNGNVGTIGISYDGYTALMSLINSHPALKACAPINPMVDGWMGDDWFRKGAFRQSLAASYIYAQTTTKDSSLSCPMSHYDEYDAWFDAISASTYAERTGVDQLPAWQRLVNHQTYDDYWESVAVDKILSKLEISVPTLNVHSQWDAEDIYGSMAVFKSLEENPVNKKKNFLVIGPWSHAGVGFENGYKLGNLSFRSDTAFHFRQNILIPFFNDLLKHEKKVPDINKVTVFVTGTNNWQTHDCWPPATERNQKNSNIYLHDNNELNSKIPESENSSLSYPSDPHNPVTYQARPIRKKGLPDSTWDEWLVDDQRFVANRPDVLTFKSQIIEEPITLAGQPIANLFASTTGTDCDWIVKLIDVYPNHVPENPKLGGYQLPLCMDILRARYWRDYSNPEPISSNKIISYKIDLPHISHVVLPGHRLMIQIQSSWFPLYDRNPQQYIENICHAKKSDFITTIQTIHCSSVHPSHINLPIISKGKL